MRVVIVHIKASRRGNIDPIRASYRGLSSALVAADTSIEAALEPVKLCQGIRKRCRDLGSRFPVQPLCLDKPGTRGRIPDGTS
jgi:hypothetical protein